MLSFSLTTEETMSRNERIEALLARMGEGDTDAVGALYDLIRTDVYAYALSKLCNRYDADDVTQDVFVRIFRYAKRYEPRGKPMAWIITIERNLICRRCEREARQVNWEAVSREEYVGDAVELVVNNEFLKLLLRALSEEEREIVLLHVVSGLKHREIAGLLGKPLSTVLSKYNRAIRKLKAVGKENGYEA